MSDLRDRIVALSPTIRARAEEADTLRRVQPETIEALRAAGLFRAFVPRRFGGDERGLHEVMEAVIELARSCASTAWVGSLLSVHGLAVAWFDTRAQEDVWKTGPDALVVSSVTPTGRVVTVDGGYRLSGRWSFVSGVDHGTWAMVAGVIPRTDKPPETILLLVPSSEYTIEDDWNVAGLRATGSKSTVLDNVYVPGERALAMTGLSPGLAVHEGRLYRLPWSPVFNSAFPAIALGTAMANLETFCESIKTRRNAYFNLALSRSPAHLMRISEARAYIDAALALYRKDLAEIENETAAMASRELEAFGERVHYDFAFIIDRCAHVVSRLFRASGGHALHAHNPVQRQFRDLHAMTQHGSFDLDLLGVAHGKTILDPTAGDGSR